MDLQSTQASLSYVIVGVREMSVGMREMLSHQPGDSKLSMRICKYFCF